MDDNFQYFLQKMGPAFARRYVPKSSMERYKGRLPDQLLEYWDEHGWCGYADGLFWTVNPQDYEPVLDAWLGETRFMEEDAYHIIARGAFGNLYLWGENSGFSLLIATVGSFAVPRSSANGRLEQRMQSFFGLRSRSENDFADYFAPALQKLGRLTEAEMYGFVPALPMGGPSKFENLQKLSAVEHMVFLAQLSDLQIMATAAR